MAVLDTNIKGGVGAGRVLTTEKTLTMYVSNRGGANGNYRLAFNVSPDGGTTWFQAGEVVRGPGVYTCQCVATNANVKVIESQGAASNVNVFLLAR